ncbi:hypothetical protein HPB48_019178 [Haemaphysalis longicornis]|uniref:Uncharacterized protein n=1 Tax=Haemaphysalis longicornis TaxID=44386 RepID=A0A9J6FUY4_HAELO|nr:hypothetical protein HPB48_019178 [Haemaphysalis longicornis]
MPRIDEATRVEILTLLQAGRTRRSMAAEVGCSLGSVTRLFGPFWKRVELKMRLEVDAQDIRLKKRTG